MNNVIVAWLTMISAAAFVAAIIGDGHTWINWITSASAFAAAFVFDKFVGFHG